MNYELRIMNRIKRRVLSSIFHISYFMAAFPLAASAANPQITVFTTPNSTLNFSTIANKFSDIANIIIPFLIGIAFVAVIWGIFKYIRSAGDSEEVAKGRMFIVYGLVGLFMMLSFWGFVIIIKNAFFGV